MTNNKKIRYLFVGGFNLAFGYLVSLASYATLKPYFHIIFIAILANILNITVSFFMYKLIVFKSKGPLLKEYFRSYMVYGVATITSILLLWVLVDFCSVPFWMAQGFLVAVTAIVSYLGHNNFTFANSSK